MKKKFTKGNKGKGSKSKSGQISGLETETDQIIEAHFAYTEANRKTSYLAIKVGRELTSTKLKVKQKKISWGNYAKEELSHIPSFEIRDFMYLSSQFDKHKYFGLLTINITNLKKFYQMCNGRPPQTVLSNHNIDLIAKDASEEEIKTFQKKILRLLQSTDRQKRAASKNKPAGKSSEQTTDNTKSNDNPLFFYRKQLLNLMQQELRKPESESISLGKNAYRFFLETHKIMGKFIEKHAPQEDED